MEQKTIKHIVQTRFLSKQFDEGADILDQELIDRRLDLMTHNLIPSLNNQSNLDFQWIVLVNPDITANQLYGIRKQIEKAKPKFKWKFIPHNDWLDRYLKWIWKTNDIVILTRIDDDDFIHKDAVQTTRDLILQHPDDKFILCGYTKGYKFNAASGMLGLHQMNGLENIGHHSIFQTSIVNTHAIEYFKKVNPLFCNHRKTIPQMSCLGVDIKWVNIDSPYTYIYYRHDDAAEVVKKNCVLTQENKKVIQMDAEILKTLQQEFAFRTQNPADFQ